MTRIRNLLSLIENLTSSLIEELSADAATLEYHDSDIVSRRLSSNFRKIKSTTFQQLEAGIRQARADSLKIKKSKKNKS